MKYCAKCGQELMDDAAFCASCGNAVAPAAPANTKQNAGSATGAIVCAFLLPVVGLIMGLIGMSKATDPQLKNKFKGAALLSVGMWIIYFLIFTVIGQL